MIRLYNHETDFEKVKDYCSKHNIAFPSRNSTLIVSFNDQGNVNGLVGMKTEVYVEPLIADNPILANNLGRMIEGVILQAGIRIVKASVPSENKKHIAQLEKEGFEITEINHTIMEKSYG